MKSSIYYIVLCVFLLLVYSCKTPVKSIESEGGTILICTVKLEGDETPKQVEEILTQRIKGIDKTIIPEFEWSDTTLTIKIPCIAEPDIKMITAHGNFSIMSIYPFNEVMPLIVGKEVLFDSIYMHDYSEFHLYDFVPLIREVEPKNIAFIDSLLNQSKVINNLPIDATYKWSVELDGKKNLYVVSSKSQNNALNISDTYIGSSVELNDRSGIKLLTIKLNKLGAEQFEKLTANNLRRQLAILMDDIVLTTPTVNNKIKEGNMTISGNFSLELLTLLNALLSSRVLKSDITVASQTIIEPSSK